MYFNSFFHTTENQGNIFMIAQCLQIVKLHSVIVRIATNHGQIFATAAFSLQRLLYPINLASTFSLSTSINPPQESSIVIHLLIVM